MKSIVSKPLTFLILSLTFYGLGCGGSSDQPDLGTVTGTVTMDGKPLAYAIISFAPSEGLPSSGQADKNGLYKLSHIGDAKGALIGKHTVSIMTGTAPSTGSSPEKDDQAMVEEIPDINDDGEVTSRPPAAKKESIPAKYNAETTLTEEVAAGSNTIDFELSLK